MASTLMHLYVGNYIKSKHGKITDLPKFYMGCVYPDSVNAFGFAPKEVRYPAHLRSRDIDEWIGNNKAFYKENKGKIDENLLWGFIVHNVTDAAYDRHFSGIDRNDWTLFNNQQSAKAWWTDEVLPALKSAVPVGMNGVLETHVREWLRNMTEGGWFTHSVEEPAEVTTEMMDKLSEIVYNVIIDFIR
jgi:hypothetical protein